MTESRSSSASTPALPFDLWVIRPTYIGSDMIL